MEQDLACGVCSELYLEGQREPVLLPNCGHTFCRRCLLSLERNGCLECPFCRRLNDDVPVLQLPVVFALLGLSRHFRRSKLSATKAMRDCNMEMNITSGKLKALNALVTALQPV